MTTAAARADTTAPALTPLKPTRFRLEKESRDGVWHYRRRESAGTPWLITHVPSGGWCYSWSLPAARRDTASGRALVEIALRHPEIAHLLPTETSPAVPVGA